MVTVCKIKGTNTVVYPVEQGERYTLCLFPFGFVSKKGHRAALQNVRNDKLEAKKYGYG